MAAIRTPSSIFKRLIIQLTQTVWAYGVQVKNEKTKDRLGVNFDKTAKKISKNAALHGVCYGFWNLDRVQMFTALEYFPLKDENTSTDMIGIRFWQIDPEKPLNVQVFEPDGWTWYIQAKGSNALVEYKVKQNYVNKVWQGGIGTQLIGGENYPSSALPVIACYANEEHTSELTTPIKNKIDLMDFILSGFGDDVLRTKVIYWILQGFSGSLNDFKKMRDAINQSGIIAAQDETTADAKVVDLPYNAVGFALDRLEAQIYLDFMGMRLEEISGGSVTATAIKAAQKNLEWKANDFEYECADFVRRILELQGVKSENIKFKRDEIFNTLETTQAVMMAASYLDQQTILEKLPFIDPTEIQAILDRLALEQLGAGDEPEEEEAGGETEGVENENNRNANRDRRVI